MSKMVKGEETGDIFFIFFRLVCQTRPTCIWGVSNLFFCFLHPVNRYSYKYQSSPSLIVLTVSVDVKQLWTWPQTLRTQELCESRGGHPGLPVPNSPYGLCGRKATLNLNSDTQELCESRGGHPGLPVPKKPDQTLININRYWLNRGGWSSK